MQGGHSGSKYKMVRRRHKFAANGVKLMKKLRKLTPKQINVSDTAHLWNQQIKKDTKFSCLSFSRKVELVYCFIWQVSWLVWSSDNGQFKDNGGNKNSSILTEVRQSFIDSPLSHNHLQCVISLQHRCIWLIVGGGNFNLPAFLVRGPSLISQLSSREGQV